MARSDPSPTLTAKYCCVAQLVLLPRRMCQHCERGGAAAGLASEAFQRVLLSRRCRPSAYQSVDGVADGLGDSTR
jgi:hypothetical protein